MPKFRFVRDYSGYSRGNQFVTIEAETEEEAKVKADDFDFDQSEVVTDIIRDDRESHDGWEIFK
jgi:hypothetical protein